MNFIKHFQMQMKQYQAKMMMTLNISDKKLGKNLMKVCSYEKLHPYAFYTANLAFS